MRMWIYTAHLISRKGTTITQSRVLTDEEYQIPDLRAIEEQIAERELRLEGITPDWPISHDGWRPIDLYMKDAGRRLGR